MFDFLPLEGTRLQLALLAGLLLAIAVGLKLLQLIVRYVRSMRPPQLHPKLQKYAGDEDPSVRRRRLLAAQIVATSSTAEIPGFNIVRAIDAIYIDGFRTPAEALEGVKAAAAEKGGNAVINVRHERNPLGRCSASGDVVLVESLQAEGGSETATDASDA